MIAQIFLNIALIIILSPVNIIRAKTLEERLPARSNQLVTNLSKVHPNLLKANETINLENKLSDFSEKSHVQIAILIVDDLLDLEPNDYTTRVFNKWGIGTKGSDQGVLILIKPTSPNRVIYINTGYGSEAILPDASCKQIIERILKPKFQQGLFYQGLDEATNIMINSFKSETSPKIKTPEKAIDPLWGIAAMLLLIGFGILLLELSPKKQKSLSIGSHHKRRRSGINFDPPIFFGGFGSGGFGGGGSFGGFGGGMSGGGGAGGDW